MPCEFSSLQRVHSVAYAPVMNYRQDETENPSSVDKIFVEVARRCVHEVQGSPDPRTKFLSTLLRLDPNRFSLRGR